MNSIESLVILFTLHFIADWGLQNRWMAENKSKYWEVLFAHSFINAGILSMFFIFVNRFNLGIFLMFFVSHFFIDYLSSNIYKVEPDRRILWIDHALHFIVMLLVYFLF